MAGPDAAALLTVRDLTTEIGGRSRRAVRAVDGVSLTVNRGEVVGLVGESGSGKSMTAFSIINLFPTAAARVVGGDVRFAGEDLRTASPARLRAVRGARIGMVFQDPMSYLDPLMPVGHQIAETLREHGQGQGAAARVIDLLATMDLPDAEQVARRYPHELSGGQRQRVLIAAALAMRPALLIADEPTTALDVTVQASILRLLLRLRQSLGLAILLITHDLGIVAEVCDRVYVMYAAQVVETNLVQGLFARPRHPYTQGLLRGTLSVEAFAGELFAVPGTVPDLRQPPAACRFHPRCPLAQEICRTQAPPLLARDGGGADSCWRALEPAAAHTWDGALAAGALAAGGGAAVLSGTGAPGEGAPGTSGAPTLIEGQGLRKTFGVGRGLFGRRQELRAVDGVSLAVRASETVALVGESGSGKSTLGRLLLGLTPPTAGEVRYDGAPLEGLRGAGRRRFRREVQVVFQDSGAALNPRRTVGSSVELPLRYGLGLDPAAARREAAALLARVGLAPEIYLGRYPHELSGGQRQRIGIARAIASRPRFVVADEPVAALDVSVRAQILALLRTIQRETGIAFLFITHDLGVVRAIAGRVLVMYLGVVVESGPVAALFANPGHPYTRALLAATPVPDPARRGAKAPPLEGEIPSPLAPPPGCRFHTRCPLAQEICRREEPPLATFPDGVAAACHFAAEVRHHEPVVVAAG